MRVKINRSYHTKKQRLKKLSGEALETIANNMAYDAPNESKYFVDTGAFITSWQIVDGRARGRPRGKSSHGLPKGQSKRAKFQESREQLRQDLLRIDFDTANSIVLRNGAPHARYVDAKHSKVMHKLRNKYGRYS